MLGDTPNLRLRHRTHAHGLTPAFAVAKKRIVEGHFFLTMTMTINQLVRLICGTTSANRCLYDHQTLAHQNYNVACRFDFLVVVIVVVTGANST